MRDEILNFSDSLTAFFEKIFLRRKKSKFKIGDLVRIAETKLKGEVISIRGTKIGISINGSDASQDQIYYFYEYQVSK